MHDLLPAPAISPLRQRLIEEMNLRRFSHETQRNDLRDVGRLATFLGRRLDTASAEDLRRFQVEQRQAGVPVPTLNGIVSALRFFFTHALDRPDLARRLVRLAYPRTLPVVLSHAEVARLLAATTCLNLKLQAVGLGGEYRCPMPITQIDLADALGLTSVHVNRVLQEMRSRTLVTLRSRTLVIEAWDELMRASEFDPMYLQLEKRAAG